MATDFVSLTELAGDDVSVEQVERLARRYYWAADFCAGKDVLETACGAGQGVGYLSSVARSLRAGDYSPALLEIAGRHYGSRFAFEQFDAQHMPFPDGAFDVVVIFEAIYYLPDLTAFFTECRRALRPGGTLLIATANKDLFDFTPSPHSHRYLGVVELERELAAFGFAVRCYGDTPLGEVSWRQRVLRPVKAMVTSLNLMPKSMSGKKLLKRLVFGNLVKMPAEITAGTAAPQAPAMLSAGQPDRGHKVLYCAATLPNR